MSLCKSARVSANTMPNAVPACVPKVQARGPSCSVESLDQEQRGKPCLRDRAKLWCHLRDSHVLEVCRQDGMPNPGLQLEPQLRRREMASQRKYLLKQHGVVAERALVWESGCPLDQSLASDSRQVPSVPWASAMCRCIPQDNRPKALPRLHTPPVCGLLSRWDAGRPELEL